MVSRMLVRGKWCAVTRTGIVIGLRYHGHRRMPAPRRTLPNPIDPRVREALCRAAMWLVIAVVFGLLSLVYGVK